MLNLHKKYKEKLLDDHFEKLVTIAYYHPIANRAILLFKNLFSVKMKNHCAELLNCEPDIKCSLTLVLAWLVAAGVNLDIF